MATTKKYETASIAAKWWREVLQNGLEQDVPANLQFVLNFARQKPIYSKQTYAKFEKELTKQLNKSLNEFGLISLYTKKHPEGLLGKCAKESFIFFKIENPFPQNILMQVTKNSVIIKGSRLHKVLFNEPQNER